jgi:small subunit ribosomal protein S9
MTDDKKSEQGEVDEPAEIAAEDVVGAERGEAGDEHAKREADPSERQLEREQAIVDTQPTSSAGTGEPVAERGEAGDEPPGEAVQRIAEATEPEPAATDVEPDATVIEGDVEYVEEAPRVKPEIPGMDLEVDIVREGEEPYREEDEDIYGEGEGEPAEEEFTQPIADAAIDLAAGARYTATGKRKTAVARVILKPGTGAYEINGRTLDVFFPRPALQRTIRTALETVGLEEKIDVVASMHGGGVSAQAGALRHAISKALVDADPNLRSELKRRGFLTRDARVKERKKAGLKKARKRPQFSKR